MPTRRMTVCLGVVLLMTGLQATATEAEDAIATCARIPSTGDRILCLENVIRQLAPTGEAVAADPMPDVGTDVAAAATMASLPAQADDESTASIVASERIDEDAARVSMPGTAAPAAVDPQPAELGAEQVARLAGEEQQQLRVQARITAYELVGTGRLRLTLDNGQVWQQTGDDDDRIARRLRGENNMVVEMWQSRSGGYRMHLIDLDRTLRVRRLQ